MGPKLAACVQVTHLAATWRLQGNKFSDRSGAFGAPGCSMVL